MFPRIIQACGLVTLLRKSWDLLKYQGWYRNIKESINAQCVINITERLATRHQCSWRDVGIFRIETASSQRCETSPSVPLLGWKDFGRSRNRSETYVCFVLFCAILREYLEIYVYRGMRWICIHHRATKYKLTCFFPQMMDRMVVYWTETFKLTNSPQ